MQKPCVFCKSLAGETALELDENWRWCKLCRDKHKKIAKYISTLLLENLNFSRAEVAVIANDLAEIVKHKDEDERRNTNAFQKR